MSIDPKLRALNIDLPACPATLVKLSLMMADDDSSMADIATLIETDMALASAVVRTVNSAMFGLLKRVETVHEAIRYLGMAQVASLTYEVGLRAAFPPTPLLQTLWDRAGVRGLAMGSIARQLDVNQWQAHTMGLFAESGRAVLMAYDAKAYMAASTASPGNAPDEATLAALELSTFGVSHAAFGAAMCQSWGLARDVADGVRGRTQASTQWQYQRPAVGQMLVICTAVDALLLNTPPATAPQAIWPTLHTLAEQVGLNVQAFELATNRVCERLNTPS